MDIIAIDLGKFKSVALIYQHKTQSQTFRTINSHPHSLHDLLSEHQPQLVLIEAGPQAGWIVDMCHAMEIQIKVANPRSQAWLWKNVKRKTDKDDAKKLLQLEQLGQLPTVHIPRRSIRQWRSLIHGRQHLVSQLTATRNRIRALLHQEALPMAPGKKGWTQSEVQKLHDTACPLEDCSWDELWRGELDTLLTVMTSLCQSIQSLEKKLDALSQSHEQARRLRSIPGVGARLSETLVAVIDDPHRFKNAKQVSSYVGLVPRQYESGTMSRHGRISKAGDKLLRSLLVEVAWLSRRHNPVLQAFYDRVKGEGKGRGRIAAVATARKLLTICWAMMRDECEWDAGKLGMS